MIKDKYKKVKEIEYRFGVTVPGNNLFKEKTFETKGNDSDTISANEIKKIIKQIENEKDSRVGSIQKYPEVIRISRKQRVRNHYIKMEEGE